MMDWKAIGQLIAPLAPTAGRFLGGLVPFPGASIIGGLIGDSIAAALGVPATPEAVGAAIQNMPADQLQARLEAVEKEAVAKYDMMARIAEAEAEDRTAQAQAINETIRAEVAANAGTIPWWHWRHQLGNVVAFEILVFPTAALFTILLGSPEKTNAIIAFSGTLVAILTIASGLLGYIAQDNTKKQMTVVTGEHAPSVTDSLATTLKKVVTKVAPKSANQPVTISIGKPAGSRD